jgi:hypothetical protein
MHQLQKPKIYNLAFFLCRIVPQTSLKYSFVLLFKNYHLSRLNNFFGGNNLYFSGEVCLCVFTSLSAHKCQIIQHNSCVCGILGLFQWCSAPKRPVVLSLRQVNIKNCVIRRKVFLSHFYSLFVFDM